MRYIYEVPVYCGRLKEWRVLNINTGTVYSAGYPTQMEAMLSIEDGQARAGMTVKSLNMDNVLWRVNDCQITGKAD